MQVNSVTTSQNFNGYADKLSKNTMKEIIKHQRKITRNLSKECPEAQFFCKDELNAIKWLQRQIKSDRIDINFEKALDGTAKDPMWVKLNEQNRQIPIYGMFIQGEEDKFTMLRKILQSVLSRK